MEFVAPADELELSLDASLAEDVAEDVADDVALCSAAPLDPALLSSRRFPSLPWRGASGPCSRTGPRIKSSSSSCGRPYPRSARSASVSGEPPRVCGELVESQSFAGQLRASLSALQAERAALAERAASLQGDLTQSLREGEVRAALETSLAEAEGFAGRGPRGN